MIEDQKKWFDKLVKDREDSANILEKPSMRGIKNSVVEKYSDQAHFIYELLQNANDAKATKSKFELREDGLFFTHNGKIHFSVSNPDTEQVDKVNNTLGHVNSITSIANSNKTESSIGKFGVGFKAVFQYTETPFIYDPNIQFKIERFIVPKKLSSDLAIRHKDETVFYFPFNKIETPPNKAYDDILGKLKKLVFPTLFLTNLSEVFWNSKNDSGAYKREAKSIEEYGDITCKKVILQQQVGSLLTNEELLLFSRSTEQGHSYSVGFFLNENDRLIPKNHSAFCFFPTKETTNLSFIIHAPFLLTDSRESIKQSENHNLEMVNLLSVLASDSLSILKNLRLIDDEIINIIPYKTPDKNDIFSPFYKVIKQKFRSEEFLPTLDGYTKSNSAYWAQDSSVIGLFSDDQLSLLTGSDNSKWVFRSLVRNQTGKDDDLRDYLNDCVCDWYDINDLLQKIDSKFIEEQSKDWLIRLYDFLNKNNSYWSDVKTKPIFLNVKNEAVAAFEKVGKDYHEILFLSSDSIKSTSRTIHSDLLINEKALEFFQSFGLREPSLKDEIYNQILPLYKSGGEIDSIKHFKLFFKYWIEEGRPEDFLDLIKDKDFILYKSVGDQTKYRGRPDQIYFPTNELKSYFEPKTDTKFVDLDNYNEIVNKFTERDLLKDFLLKLGVSETPRIIDVDISNRPERFEVSTVNGSRLKTGSYGYDGQGTFDKVIDGCREIIDNINKENSRLLWKMISKINLSNLIGIHKYYYYTQQYQRFESSTLKLLKESKWLLTKSGDYVSPNEITIDELDDCYSRSVELEQKLEFKPIVELSKAERIASKFESEEEAEEARLALIDKRNKEKFKHEQNVNDSQKKIYNARKELSNTIESLENLVEVALNPNIEKSKSNSLPDFDENSELAKGIEDLKKQLEIRKSRAELADSINSTKKYSYDWFKAYLQLMSSYGEKQDIQKQKTISFQEIKPFKADKKYFLLCGASNYISSEIENAEDFKVSIIFRNGNRLNVSVEGVSKKGQDLLIYCREPLSDSILSKLTSVFKVDIIFTPIIDLLDRLNSAFTNTNYLDSWSDIRTTLPGLNYIYGPPGTGKTTTICNKVNGMLESKSDTKVLVLTPTNKASDVLVRKLYDLNPQIRSVRLSRPTDPELEELNVYCDTVNLDDIHSINVVATTIHRLPYFEIHDFGLIFQYKWDYVIFDEASMIGLHYMVFSIMSLVKSNSNIKFIIAGDPKQIPPIIDINDKELENFDFQDENIYKMMDLSSFDPNKQILRIPDSILNLSTQYRSVPQIGQLFSDLSYLSLLKHDRIINRKDSKPLPKRLQNLITSSVTFIDLPLNQDHAVYRINKLFYSSYHTYSALLVSELISFFQSDVISTDWSIGVIAPYKAQAILLNKLITSLGIHENVKVVSDTVHGFQGDECDLVFFICNPNNYFYSGHEKSLLSKEYIYNVAVSRAKDYLVVLHPFSKVSNPFISKIEQSHNSSFGKSIRLSTNEIERHLFNNENYIEENSYISGHDSVNVFGHSEMKYFIKANDTAIDIQIDVTK